MSKPIAVLKLDKEFIDLKGKGNDIYYFKVNMMLEHLRKTYDWLPSCCRISDSFLTLKPDGTGETEFFVECKHESSF